MKIAFDYQIFAAQDVGGVSRYYVSLARELARLGEHVRIVAPLYRNRFLGDLAETVVVGWKEDKLPLHIAVVNQAFNVMATRALIGALKPDVVHETYYSPVRSAPRRTPTVLTVFDMIHEQNPPDFRNPKAMSAIKRTAVERADHVICISEHTKSDLMRLFGCPEKKISVIYLAAEGAPRSTRKQESPASTPFLLYVGNRHEYKNFSGLLLAVAPTSIMRDFTLLCFGGGPFTLAETTAIAAAGLAGRVRQVSGDDALLDEMYGKATALVYPSSYEGFGLPPLEAMARGCPVISSNASSLPEVVGDAAELFDPADPVAMVHAIEAVVYSETRRAELIQRGLVRARQFSWRRCAQETLAVYRSLVA